MELVIIKIPIEMLVRESKYPNMARTKTTRTKAAKGKQRRQPKPDFSSSPPPSPRFPPSGRPRAGPSSALNRQQVNPTRKSIQKRKKQKSTSSDTTPSSSSKSIRSSEKKRAKAAKKKSNRLRIDFDSAVDSEIHSGPDHPSPEEEEEDQYRSPSSPSPAAPKRGPKRAQKNQRRNDPIQPLRFPSNPTREIIDKWLQKKTANPYVKLSNSKLAKAKPCSNLYFKFARVNSTTGKITKLLPGGVLTRNEHPLYIMLRGINNPKPFSVQLSQNKIYIRKLDIAKIEEEYEKNKIYQAVQQLDDENEEEEEE